MTISKDPTFGTRPGKIALSFKSMPSGKSGMEKVLYFGRTRGSSYLPFVTWKILILSDRSSIWIFFEESKIFGIRFTGTSPGDNGKQRNWNYSSQRTWISKPGKHVPPTERYQSKTDQTFKDRPNILRWGHSTTGIFSVNEAYYLQGNYQDQDLEIIWRKIWNGILWPKVSICLWLIAKNGILTWDNLLKRGFIGPSRCTLCH